MTKTTLCDLSRDVGYLARCQRDLLGEANMVCWNVLRANLTVRLPGQFQTETEARPSSATCISTKGLVLLLEAHQFHVDLQRLVLIVDRQADAAWEHGADPAQRVN